MKFIEHDTLPPDLTAMFLSCDPMQDMYAWITPYHYCLNNPLWYTDPTGMFVEDGNFHDWSGKYLGTDGKTDDKIYIVRDSKSQKTIKQNEKAGKTTDASSVQVAIKTSKTELTEALDVLDRTEKNGGYSEEGSIVTSDGKIYRAKTGEDGRGKNAAALALPYVEGDDRTSIHSHPTNMDGSDYWDARYPGPDDPATFSKYQSNIIVGGDKPNEVGNRNRGAFFFDRNAEFNGFLREKAMKTIIKN